jgi:hypothetical protein
MDGWGQDGWPTEAEYRQREASLKRDGLDVQLFYNVEDGFVSLTVHILRGTRLREVSPHRLHVTICWDNEVDSTLLQEIAAAWHGRRTHLNVGWCGSGGTAFIENCLLSECPLVARAHSLGWYRDRDLHISF